MPFIATIEVIKCIECPYKRLVDKVKGIEHYVCSEIASKPSIGFNRILPECPFDRKERFLESIADYVGKSQQ